AAEVEKRGAAEAGGEGPIGPGPGLAMVARPGELRIAGVAGEQVKNAVDHQHTAGFLATWTVADCFERGSTPILGLEVGRIAGDANQPETELGVDERFEAFAVAVSGVKGIVVGPGGGPVVATAGLTDDRRS